MATEQQGGASAAEELNPNETGEELETQAPEAGADQEGADEPGPYDALAESMGWVPKDKYSGPAENWKPAEQFIRDGRDIQRDTARELKELKSTVETIAKTSAQIAQEALERQRHELLVAHTQAVEDGDPKRAFEISQDIAKLGTADTARPTPSPAAQDWAKRNANWFQKDPDATRRAFELTQQYAGMGYDHATQLAETEKTLRRERPDLFPANGKPAAAVNSPGSRSASPSNRAKGFSDMPPKAQQIAKDMVERKVIPNTDAYTKMYWQNAERKA